MLQELNQLKPSYSFSLKTIDIRDHPDLTKQYGSRIPVLVANGEEICHFTLDTERVTSCLENEGTADPEKRIS